MINESNSFNINIEDYSLDDLFNLLNIKVDSQSNYDTITQKIINATDAYISTFEKLNNKDVVLFFNNVKRALLGTKETQTTSEQNVLTYVNRYVPNQQNKLQVDPTDMFNSNNGSGNPVHRKTISKLLNIDSRFRDNYLFTSPTNFIVDLPYPINNVIEMTLSDLEIPSTYYAINAANQNNYFWMYAMDSSYVEYYYYIIVPDGNYYFTTLISLINNTVAGMSVALPISIFFNLSYDNLGGVGDGNGLITIGSHMSDIVKLSGDLNQYILTKFELNFEAIPLDGVTSSLLIINNSSDINRNLINSYNIKSNIKYQQRLGWMFGYRRSKYIDAMYDSISQLLHTSESILDLLGPKYLFLLVDDFNKSINTNFFTASITGLLPDNVIARIAIKSPAFNIQVQNDFSVYSEPRYYYGPVNVNKLQIQLVDEYGRILNLNNKDFSFTIRLTTIYSAT